MAKRKISDIIDLTFDDEEVEDDEKRKGSRALSSSVYGGLQEPSATQNNPSQLQRSKSRKVSTSISAPVAFANGAPIEAGKGDEGSGFSPFRASAEIVQPIVARGDARTFYDPQTIAHNILVATGCHPWRPGLNDHLQVENFPNAPLL
jgi:hypothetical protein